MNITVRSNGINLTPKVGAPELPDPATLFDHSLVYVSGATKYKWISPIDGQVSIEKTNISNLYVAGDNGLEEITANLYNVAFGNQYIFHINATATGQTATLRLKSNQDIITPDIQSISVKPIVRTAQDIRGKYVLVCTTDTAALSVLSNRLFFLYDADLLVRSNWNSTTLSYNTPALIRQIDVPKRANGTLYTVTRLFWWRTKFYVVLTRPGNYGAIYIITYDPVTDVWADMDGTVGEYTLFQLPNSPIPMYVGDSLSVSDQRQWHLNQVTGEIIMYNIASQVQNRNITKINLDTKVMTNQLIWPNDTELMNGDDILFVNSVGLGGSAESTQGPTPVFGRRPLKNLIVNVRPAQLNIQAYDENRGLIYAKNWTDDTTSGSRRLMAFRVKDQSLAFEIINATTSVLAGAPTIYFEDIDTAVMWGVQSTNYRFTRFHIGTLTSLVSSFGESNTVGSIPTAAVNPGTNVTVNYEKRQIYTIMTTASYRMLIQHHESFNSFGLTHFDYASVASTIIDIAVSSRQY